MSPPEGTINDRQSFRLDDEMLVFYRPARPEEQETMQFDRDIHDSEPNSLLGMINTLNLETSAQLKALYNESPKLASILRGIDLKIHFLAENLSSKDSSLHTEPQIVNLSETGIGFHTKEKFELGDLIRVELILKPSYHDIAAYGKIMRCEHEPENKNRPWWVAIQFEKISHLDSQILCRHILQKQTLQDDEY